jgi:hypothetical protein
MCINSASSSKVCRGTSTTPTRKFPILADSASLTGVTGSKLDLGECFEVGSGWITGEHFWTDTASLDTVTQHFRLVDKHTNEYDNYLGIPTTDMIRKIKIKLGMKCNTDEPPQVHCCGFALHLLDP